MCRECGDEAAESLRGMERWTGRGDGVDEFNRFLNAMPAHLAERAGRMHGMGLRLVLAYMDGEPHTVAALVQRVGTWDGEPGRTPYPLPVYDFCAGQVLNSMAVALDVLERVCGAALANQDLAADAIGLVERYGPEQHRDEAVARLRAITAGSGAIDIRLPGTEPGPVDLVMAAAGHAAVCVHPRATPIRHQLRWELVSRIREVEAIAVGAPDRERVNEISDGEALAFLNRIIGGGWVVIPEAPSERALWEFEMLAVAKTHLVDTPADATTPEQADALRDQVDAVLNAVSPLGPALDALFGIAHPARRSGPPPRGARRPQRHQPRAKKPKRKR